MCISFKAVDTHGITVNLLSTYKGNVLSEFSLKLVAFIAFIILIHISTALIINNNPILYK